MLISYKGKSVNTQNYIEISEEDRKRLQVEYYMKPPKEEVIKQIKKINSNGVKDDKITNYYFKDLMAKTQIKTAKWTVEDVFESKELLGMFKAKTLNNKSVFPDNKSEIDNIKTAIRLGGKGYAKLPTKFPVKTVKYILSNYNINNNYYDFSCGWGNRLEGALALNINYFGTDPNNLLCERLEELNKDWHENTKTTSSCNIRPQGSEIYIPEWENTIGIAFSSPPYFDLEDYKIGNQSYKENTSYENWKNNYLFPTFDNIYKYLINGGILALNIKNINGYNLLDDSIEYLSQNFNFLCFEDLKNNRRLKSTGELGNNDEYIAIFKKAEG